MEIVKSTEGNVLYLTFSNPEKLNSLEPEDWNTMTEYLLEFESGNERFLVIRGEGQNYSTGAQLSQDTVSLMADVTTMAKTLWNTTKPVISVVDGLIVGASANLALMSDFIICSKEAKFIEIFAKRGLVIDFGGGWLLPRLIGFQNSNKLALLADSIDSEELSKLGLIYKCVDRDDLDSELELLLRRLQEVSFNSICRMKTMMRKGLEIGMDDYLDLEHDIQLETFEHPDGIEGAMSFLEKRKPDFK